LIVVKAVDQLRRQQELPVPPRQEVLLEEIRDILKARA
jgi:hypothetical protein